MYRVDIIREAANKSSASTDYRISRDSFRPANFAVIAWVCMFFSIMVLRLSDLETTGLGNRDNYYRITLVLFSALAASSVAITNRGLSKYSLSVPLILLMSYGIYAMITSLFVTKYSLYGMWKGFEIVIDVSVVMALLSYKQSQGNVYIAYRFIIIAFSFMISLWWIEALIWPSEAFVPMRGYSGFQLQGLSPYYNPNVVGFNAALVAFSMICQFNNRRGAAKIISFLIFMIAIITLISSQSRTNVGGFIIAICLYLFFTKRYLLMTLVLSMAAALLLATSFGDVTKDYLLRGQALENLSSLSGRAQAWEKAWDAFLVSPYFGSGFVVYTRAEIFGIGGSSHLHSALLEALVGTGIVGTSFWVGALLWIGAGVLRLRHVKLAYPRNDSKVISGEEMMGVFVLVMTRALTDSGPAMHDHSFMVLLAVAAFVSVMADPKNSYT